MKRIPLPVVYRNVLHRRQNAPRTTSVSPILVRRVSHYETSPSSNSNASSSGSTCQRDEQQSDQTEAEEDELESLADRYFDPDVVAEKRRFFAEQEPPAASPPETSPESLGYLRQLLGRTLWSRSTTSTTDKQIADKAKPPVKPVKLTRQQLAQRAMAREVERRRQEDNLVACIYRLRSADTNADRVSLIGQLCQMFLSQPDLVSLAAEHDLHAQLLRLAQQPVLDDEDVQQHIRLCQALIGWTSPPRGRGIRILCIDGGGTRGMISLEVLEALEYELGGRPLHTVFDMFVGVSTGSIMSALLGAYQLSISECKDIYREISTRLFAQTRLSGVSGLLWSHSYYNTAEWVKLLKATLGTTSMMESAKKLNAPKLAYLSCVVNTAKLEPFIFRNYAHPPNQAPTYTGSCKFHTWEALQASAAAPGYFEEVVLDNLVHQDGGVLVNNPTAVGLNEARALWPDASIQCVLSIGNGRSMLSIPTSSDENMVKLTTATTSLQHKIVKIVDSATDTELVHQAMTCLLDPTCYYRINPYMSHAYTLDEIDPGKLAQMEMDAQMYIRRNRPKIRQLAKTLSTPRSRSQKLIDTTRLQLMTKFGYGPAWA